MPLSIDFTGGTVWDIHSAADSEPGAVRQVFVDAGHGDTSVFTFDDGKAAEVKFKPVTAKKKNS